MNCLNSYLLEGAPMTDTCENCGYQCTYDDLCNCWTCDSCGVTFDEDHPRVDIQAVGFSFMNNYCKECYENR